MLSTGNLSDEMPQWEVVVFSGMALYQVYFHYLKPYIGPVAYFIDEQTVIMEDFYLWLEDRTYYECPGLSAILDDLDVVSEVKSAFLVKWHQTLELLSSDFERTMKGKLLVEYKILNGYTLVAYGVTYNNNKL